MDPSAHGPHPERPAELALLTVSDTRTEQNDASGSRARELVQEAGHRVYAYRILSDEPRQIRAQVKAWLEEPGCDGVIVSGGTGISPRDRTHEALAGLLEQKLEGFGELFRVLSFESIGSAAMLSRAVGGIARGKPLFCLPGSVAAVDLGLRRLVLPEIPHLLAELGKR